MTDKSYLFWNSLEIIEAYQNKHLIPVEVVKPNFIDPKNERLLS